MKKKLLLSLLLCVAPAAQAEILELHEAIKETIQTNPTIKERLKNYNAVIEDLHYAKGAYLPRLDLKVGFGKERVQSNFTNNQVVDSNVQQHSVTASYNIFNGFGDKYTISQQRARLLAAAYSYLENVDDIVLKLIEQYINILRHKELMVVEKDNIKMDEKIYDDMLGKQKQGLQRLSDLKEARSKLALAYTNHLSEENNIQDTLVNFHKYFGRYVSIHEIKDPEFHEQLPSTIEEITRLAIENNPSIKVATYERLASRHEYQASKKQFYPSIDLELSGSYSENLSGIQSTNTNLRAMIYLSYNLFNGGSDSAYAQKKISTIHQKDQELNKIKRDVIESIQLSWTAFRITSKQSVFIDWYVKSSKDKLNSYYKEFNLGRRSLIDLLGASDDYNNARRKQINTKYDLMFARYRLLDAMGELTEAVGLDVRKNVGLSYTKNLPHRDDELPLERDYDKDMIVNSEDLCNNSSENNQSDRNISHYGCRETIHTNNSEFRALESFLTESIKGFVKEKDKSEDEIEGWDE